MKGMWETTSLGGSCQRIIALTLANFPALLGIGVKNPDCVISHLVRTPFLVILYLAFSSRSPDQYREPPSSSFASGKSKPRWMQLVVLTGWPGLGAGHINLL